MDNGYFSESNITGCETLGIAPYIATGREPHHRDWRTFFQEQGEPPAEDASPKIQLEVSIRLAEAAPVIEKDGNPSLGKVGL